MTIPTTASAVIADLWSRVIERVEGEPRAEAPTEFSTGARWDAVLARVDGAGAPLRHVTVGPRSPFDAGAAGSEPAPTTAAEAVSAWDRAIERASPPDAQTLRSTGAGAVDIGAVGMGADGVARVEWWR